MYHTIKQVEERNVVHEIDRLLWSDRMDLVAFSNIKGEVALHRLSWARAWSLGPPKDGLLVKGIAWRPDGKVLAIAYSSGQVLLINVENKTTVHKIEIEGDISCLLWVREKVENKIGVEEEEQSENIKYFDNSSKYLPDLPSLSNLGPSLSTNNEENANSNLFREQKELNLLIIGTQDGFVHISIFGQFSCAILNMNDHVGYKCSVINAHFSNDLSLMYTTIKDDSNNIKIIVINTSIFKTHSKELFAIALKHGHLNNLITYLSNVIVPMKETWETILLEMDAKLSKYASKVPEGTLSAEFLDLLMFGIASSTMEEFLLHDLTEKGLKKFGQVIEMCYTNIQKLLLKHVTKAGQNITYHLAELRGMARLEHRFNIIGLNESTVTKAIGSSGAFLTKGGEMHQIIIHFMINYKAFFRWLYAAIINLMDVQVLPDMPKNTQQDISRITEFVLNFDNIKSGDGDGKPQFTMERLGQYLNDAPLSMPIDATENVWENFLARNQCIEDDPSIIKHYMNYSLIQQFKHLAATIEEIFIPTKSLISEQFNVKTIFNCLTLKGETLRITEINVNNDYTLISFLNKSPPAEGIFMLEIRSDLQVRSAYFFFQDNSDLHSVVDIKFYTGNALTVLLQDNTSHTGILYQFLLGNMREKLIPINPTQEISEQVLPKLNGMDVGVAVQKHIEGMACSQFSVSGCRRVSIVLSENRKKVRLFEMEAEEDEEEDADMTNSARESDASMQEDSSTVE